MSHKWKYEPWGQGPEGFRYAITDVTGDIIALVRRKDDAAFISRMSLRFPLIQQQANRLLTEARTLHKEIEDLGKVSPLE